ncbi:hypothetical protein [Magnetospirillum molischianum]|uniref:Uncharacterized protein n=1 Tax=Magnetospirillum molischianum DSM 120 TaxID=1150626 RepID=H8FND0_MAGML|nr:hypothetical protein [Magnetospirillum molischianum]CCG39868.1 hypothetical protein PHAMO_10293 [Magnetospirillum molischianum DSM 120]
MFKRDIILRQPQDAPRELARFRSLLTHSGLPDVTAALLAEQVESTLLQFQFQMSVPHVKKIVADRVLEGDGYRVTIEIRLGSESLLAKVLRLFRGG